MQKLLGYLARPIHQSYFVVALATGIVIGVILALVFRINFFASPLWLAAALVLLALAYFQPRLAFVSIALIAGMLCSFFRAATELRGENYIHNLVGQTIVVAGTVAGDPNSDESATKFKLFSLKFGESGEYDVAGSLYISVKLTDQIARGDSIQLKGKLMDGFGTYSGFMYHPSILAINRPDPGDLILKTRNWFADRIKSQIPSPEYTLGISYLLGMKAGLPDNLSDNLRAVGLAHIVVASGAHLSILVEIARKIFGRLSRFSGLFFSIIFILFFMTMVGFTPSIMRAGIMAILNLITWYVGRKIAPWRLILLTAAATLMMNPMFIIDLGWLLSFASFAGIMIISPKVTRFFYGNHSPGIIAGTIITTMCATLATLPITLYFFGSISIVLIIANLLILPTLPFAMGLTFFAGAVSAVPVLGDMVAFAATKLLDFHIFVVNLLAEPRSLIVQIEPNNPWVFLIYFSFLMPLGIYFTVRKIVSKTLA